MVGIERVAITAPEFNPVNAVIRSKVEGIADHQQIAWTCTRASGRNILHEDGSSVCPIAPPEFSAMAGRSGSQITRGVPMITPPEPEYIQDA